MKHFSFIKQYLYLSYRYSWQLHSFYSHTRQKLFVPFHNEFFLNAQLSMVTQLCLARTCNKGFHPNFNVRTEKTFVSLGISISIPWNTTIAIPLGHIFTRKQQIVQSLICLKKLYLTEKIDAPLNIHTDH